MRSNECPECDGDQILSRYMGHWWRGYEYWCESCNAKLAKRFSPANIVFATPVVAPTLYAVYLAIAVFVVLALIEIVDAGMERVTTFGGLIFSVSVAVTAWMFNKPNRWIVDREN